MLVGFAIASEDANPSTNDIKTLIDNQKTATKNQ